MAVGACAVKSVIRYDCTTSEINRCACAEVVARNNAVRKGVNLPRTKATETKKGVFHYRIDLADSQPVSDQKVASHCRSVEGCVLGLGRTMLDPAVMKLESAVIRIQLQLTTRPPNVTFEP